MVHILPGSEQVSPSISSPYWIWPRIYTQHEPVISLFWWFEEFIHYMRRYSKACLFGKWRLRRFSGYLQPPPPHSKPDPHTHTNLYDHHHSHTHTKHTNSTQHFIHKDTPSYLLRRIDAITVKFLVYLLTDLLEDPSSRSLNPPFFLSFVWFYTITAAYGEKIWRGTCL